MSNVNNVPLKGSAPAGSPGSYTSKEQITALLKGTDPGAVSRAGKSFVSFASAYEQMVANLKSFSNELADAWTGPASNAAQERLLDMHESAMQIFQQSDSAGRAVQAHGDSYLTWYHSSMPTPKTTQEAQQWMQAANGRISQTWQAMPDNLTTKLPKGSREGWGTPDGGPSGASGGTGGGGGSSSGYGPAGGGSGSGHQPQPSSAGGDHSHRGLGNWRQDGPGHGPGNTSPKTSAGDGQNTSPFADGTHRTNLSAFDPSSSGSGGPGGNLGPGSGLGGGGGGPLGSLPFGGGGGPSAGGIPGSSGIGIVPGGGPGVIPGGGGASAGTRPGIAGAGAAGRSGASGLAGVPGHGGSGEKDRERNRGAWLAEERSLWDGDVESVPGIIGEAPRQLEEPQEAEQQNTAEPDEQNTADLLRAALARIMELEVRNAEQRPSNGPSET